MNDAMNEHRHPRMANWLDRFERLAERGTDVVSAEDIETTRRTLQQLAAAKATSRGGRPGGCAREDAERPGGREVGRARRFAAVQAAYERGFSAGFDRGRGAA